MPRTPTTPKPEPAPEVPVDVTAESQAVTDAKVAQAGRRLQIEHRRLKLAFADLYVELIGVREENVRVNVLLQESQRVIGEVSKRLPKDEPVT